LRPKQAFASLDRCSVCICRIVTRLQIHRKPLHNECQNKQDSKACACATCHVYVAEGWTDKLKAKDDMEDSMLDFAEGVQDNSRLCCQILMSDELDGITVSTPESQ